VNAAPPTSSTNVALGAVPNDVGATTFFTLGGLTTGLTDVNLSFAIKSEGTGAFTELDLGYSTDGGVTYSASPFATAMALENHTSYTALSFDVSTLTGGAVDGVSGDKLFFQFSFLGDPPGTTLIDNIQVTAVPEPSSYIGGLLGLVGLCWYQRPWFMRLLSLRSA
jgi:hypothetical protein